MFFYMSGDQYQIADHCTDPSVLNFALRFGSAAALERFLSDNAENVVSKNGKLQDKLVGVKFPGRKPFDISTRYLPRYRQETDIGHAYQWCAR